MHVRHIKIYREDMEFDATQTRVHNRNGDIEERSLQQKDTHRKQNFDYLSPDLIAIKLSGSPVQRNDYAHMSPVIASAAIFRILPIGDNCVG